MADDGIGIIPRAARSLFEKLIPAPNLIRSGSGIKVPNRYSMSSVPLVNGTKPSSQPGDQNWQLKATYVEVRFASFSPTLQPSILAAH